MDYSIACIADYSIAYYSIVCIDVDIQVHACTILYMTFVFTRSIFVTVGRGWGGAENQRRQDAAESRPHELSEDTERSLDAVSSPMGGG